MRKITINDLVKAGAYPLSVCKYQAAKLQDLDWDTVDVIIVYDSEDAKNLRWLCKNMKIKLVIEHHYPDYGGVWRWIFDDAGRIVEQHDPCGNVWRWVHDNIGRIIEEHCPDGEVRRWVYDQAGHMIEKHDLDGDVYRWIFDDAGRIVEQHDPCGDVWHYVYDAGECIEVNIYEPVPVPKFEIQRKKEAQDEGDNGTGLYLDREVQPTKASLLMVLSSPL